MYKIQFISVLVACSLIAPISASADKAAGKALYDGRCVTCHGPQGAGDGPIAAGLPAEMRPRNLQEGKFKFSTDQAKFIELITKGGSAVGLNPLMPPQPDLKEADMKNLYEFVIGLKK